MNALLGILLWLLAVVFLAALVAGLVIAVLGAIVAFWLALFEMILGVASDTRARIEDTFGDDEEVY